MSLQIPVTNMKALREEYKKPERRTRIFKTPFEGTGVIITETCRNGSFCLKPLDDLKLLKAAVSTYMFNQLPKLDHCMICCKKIQGYRTQGISCLIL